MEKFYCINVLTFQIISVAINSAQSISLKNIVVPKPIADHDLDEAKTVSASGATANSPGKYIT